MLSVIMLSVVLLNVVMLNVVAPIRAFVTSKSFQHALTFADKATYSLLTVNLYKVHYSGRFLHILANAENMGQTL
jgi:hypothetical protein